MEQYYFDWFNIAKSKAMSTFMRNFFLQYFYKVKVPKEVALQMQNKLQEYLQKDLDENLSTYCSNQFLKKEKWYGFEEIEKIVQQTLPCDLIFKLNFNTNIGYLYFVNDNKPIAIGSFEFDYFGKLSQVTPLENNVPILGDSGVRAVVRHYKNLKKNNPLDHFFLHSHACRQALLHE